MHPYRLPWYLGHVRSWSKWQVRNDGAWAQLNWTVPNLARPLQVKSFELKAMGESEPEAKSFGSSLS